LGLVAPEDLLEQPTGLDLARALDQQIAQDVDGPLRLGELGEPAARDAHPGAPTRGGVLAGQPRLPEGDQIANAPAALEQALERGLERGVVGLEIDELP